MSPERWQRVKRLLESSLEMEPEKRKAHLAAACAGDEALEREVESLLESHGRAAEFLEVPAWEGIEEAPAEDLTGQRIGPYQVTGLIAQGGMGAVYRAVRADDFEKRVAIKLVKRGMDTDFLLQRFRGERQILAGLDHPNIARLLDGGAAASGRPYLVMEYIDGEPITDYCDRRRLGIAERLNLFRTVCSAVAYAHQRLIVHRDLKPANVLVTAEGVPALVDFGVAKLLEPNTDATVAGVRLMTPEYASPEQARGEPVTTASDVYSLGVLLYELLTGRRPEVRHADADPRKPSTVVDEAAAAARGGGRDRLRRRLAGDLDGIVLKAMRVDPARRYPSALLLEDDIRRHLEGLPVTARKGTVSYRASKFVRRHRGATAAAGLVLATLVGGIATTSWEAHVARIERARAERRFNDVRRMADSILFELHDAIAKLPGSTPARKLLVQRALQFLDRLAQETGSDASLDRDLAAAYQRLGEVQGRPGSSNLGDVAGAIASYRKAIALEEKVAASSAPAGPGAQRALATSYQSLAAALDQTGDSRASDEYLRKAYRIREAVVAQYPNDRTALRDLAASFHNLGVARGERGDPAGALQYHQKYLDISRRLAGATPSRDDRHGLSLAHKRIGALLLVESRYKESLEHYQAAVALDEALVAEDPNNASAQLDLTYGYSDMGLIHFRQKDYAAALASFEKARVIRERVAAADPKNERAQLSLGVINGRVGMVLWQMGQRNRAMEFHRRAFGIFEALSRSDPENVVIRANLLESCLTLGSGYAGLAGEAHGTERVRLIRQARDYDGRSQRIYQDLKARGADRSRSGADWPGMLAQLDRSIRALAR